MTNVYFAYPIDQRHGIDGLFPRVAEAQRQCLNEGWSIYDPGEAFSVPSVVEVGPWVSQVNFAAVNGADVVFAFLPAGVPTIGVVMEIDRAALAGKFVVIVTEAPSFSLEDYRMRPNCRIVDETEDGTETAVQWLRRVTEEQATEDLGETPGVSGPVAPLSFVVEPGGRLPSRGYNDDAGLDLYVSKDTRIGVGQFVDVPCDVKVELPEWTWGLITGRSSTLRNRHLLVHSGIIDPGWRGQLFAGTMNIGNTIQWVQAGERIAQLILLPNVTREFEPVAVTELTAHPRGVSGFGSTGV